LGNQGRIEDEHGSKKKSPTHSQVDQLPKWGTGEFVDREADQEKQETGSDIQCEIPDHHMMQKERGREW